MTIMKYHTPRTTPFQPFLFFIAGDYPYAGRFIYL